MTDMRRITISLPDELERRITELKKEDRFVKVSYSELVRYLLNQGLEQNTSAATEK